MPTVNSQGQEQSGDYTYAQLEELWENAGGSSALAPIMAAIAMAESSGNSDAYNASGASGLWQILGAVNPADQSQLFNPIVNAKEAVLKYQTQGLTAWVTYTSGAYKQFLKSGVAPSSGSTGGASTTSSTSLDPSAALSEMGELFHGISEGLNWAFYMFEPGQGWRAAMAIGGTASGVLAAKLYTSPSVSQEKSAAFPSAILLTGISLLCLYMTLRAWPVNSEGQAIRPATYAVAILKGEKPPAGPGPTDNTNAIQGGLEAIASIWIVYQSAQIITGLAGAAGVLGTLWAGIKSLFGAGGGEGETEIPDIPLTALTVPSAPGVTGTQTV